MESTIIFSVGARKKELRRIIPVFLPFLGCPCKCVYCVQDKQTGKIDHPCLGSMLQEAAAMIERQDKPCELAFYGGTFTAIPEKNRMECLDFLQSMRKSGKVVSARCSTRPDALGKAILLALKNAGIHLVELGVQSFSDHALAASQRGYNGKQALDGCQAVLKSGLRLGIQLLPGMPGVTPKIFIDDVQKAIALHPACLRFYPCLVPEGTILADWFASGKYKPWSMEETITTLAKALTLAWNADIPVIRLSVAPEPAFDTSILAGPRHPALGALIQCEALLISTKNAIKKLGREPRRLELPFFCQGFMFGEGGYMRTRWNELGLGQGRIAFYHGHTAQLF